MNLLQTLMLANFPPKFNAISIEPTHVTRWFQGLELKNSENVNLSGTLPKNDKIRAQTAFKRQDSKPQMFAGN